MKTLFIIIGSIIAGMGMLGLGYGLGGVIYKTVHDIKEMRRRK